MPHRVVRRRTDWRLPRWLPRLLRLRRYLAELLLLTNRRWKERVDIVAGVLRRHLFRRRCTDVQHSATLARCYPCKHLMSVIDT